VVTGALEHELATNARTKSNGNSVLQPQLIQGHEYIALTTDMAS